MRVLFVFPAYEPAWAFGGVVRCASNLCPAMAKLGADVTVYTTNVNGRGGLLPVPVGTTMEVGGVSVTYFSSTFGRNSVWDSRSLTRKLDETISSFDIVYVSAIWQWIGISVAQLARKHQVPYIVGTHGAFNKTLLRVSRIKKTIYYQLFLKKCIQKAAAIHFTTEYERCESLILKTEQENFVVQNCMSPLAFKINQSLCKRLREEFNIPNNAPLLLSVGRLGAEKRLDITLKAFRMFSEQFAEGRLMIVGDTNNAYSQKMKALSDALCLGEKVIWAGYRFGKELDVCYAAADIFLLPSMGENFSMVVTEAMAAGLPVIVSNRVGVAADVERYNAGIVTEVNSEQLGRAVINLFCDRPRLREMGENAQKVARQLYSSDQVAPLMLEHFESVLLKTSNSERI